MSLHVKLWRIMSPYETCPSYADKLLEQLKKRYILIKDSIIRFHSAYQTRINEMEFNSYLVEDNVLIESFFAHLRDCIDYQLATYLDERLCPGRCLH